MIDQLIRGARQRERWSLRVLGRRAHTSHATLAAYESGRVSPTTETLVRVVRAAGFEIEPALVPVVSPDSDRGEELRQVLELAAEFPARHHSSLQCPVWGRP